MVKNTPFRKDWFLLGFTTGAAASVAKTLTNLALHEWGVPTVFYGSMASAMVLNKREGLGHPTGNDARSKADWVIGYGADAMAGGLFGAALAYLHTKTPPGNELATLQGAVLGRVGTSLITQSHPTLVRPVSRRAFNRERMRIMGPTTG